MVKIGAELAKLSQNKTGYPFFLDHPVRLSGLLGMVYDETKNYDNSFHVGGAMLLTGGLLLCLLHLPPLRRSASDHVDPTMSPHHTDIESITADQLPLPQDNDDAKDCH